MTVTGVATWGRYPVTLYHFTCRFQKPYAAYLVTCYAKRYDLPQIPGLVKKTIILITNTIGQIMGKYKKCNDAPEPLSK